MRITFADKVIYCNRLGGRTRLQLIDMMKTLKEGKTVVIMSPKKTIEIRPVSRKKAGKRNG